MKANIGNVDRILRFIAGIGIVAAGFYFKSWWGLLGIVPLLTATLRFCPPYALLGMSTCRHKTTEKAS